MKPVHEDSPEAETEEGYSFYEAGTGAVAEAMLSELEYPDKEPRAMDDFREDGRRRLWKLRYHPDRVVDHNNAGSNLIVVPPDGSNEESGKLKITRLLGGEASAKGRTWSSIKVRSACGVIGQRVHSRLAPLHTLSAEIGTDGRLDAMVVVLLDRERSFSKKLVEMDPEINKITNRAERVPTGKFVEKYRDRGYVWNNPYWGPAKSDVLMIELYILVQLPGHSEHLYPVRFIPMKARGFDYIDEKAAIQDDLDTLAGQITEMLDDIQRHGPSGLNLTHLIIPAFLPLGLPFTGLADIRDDFEQLTGQAEDEAPEKANHPIPAGYALGPMKTTSPELLLKRLSLPNLEIISAVDGIGVASKGMQGDLDPRVAKRIFDGVKCRMNEASVRRFNAVGHPAMFHGLLNQETAEGVMHMLLAGHVAREMVRSKIPD